MTVLLFLLLSIKHIYVVCYRYYWSQNTTSPVWLMQGERVSCLCTICFGNSVVSDRKRYGFSWETHVWKVKTIPRVIHISFHVNLAKGMEKYYNGYMLSWAEWFCLCMFVQDHERPFSLFIWWGRGGGKLNSSTREVSNHFREDTSRIVHWKLNSRKYVFPWKYR